MVTGPVGSTRVSSQFDSAKLRDELCSNRKTAVYDSIRMGYEITMEERKRPCPGVKPCGLGTQFRLLRGPTHVLKKRPVSTTL